MFTGLVEGVGTVTQLAAAPGGWRLRVRTALAPELTLGESLSVDGVCLTVAHIVGDEVSADIGPETARVTTLGALRPSQAVNLERAARADTRLGGHLVQGHVDATVAVDRVDADGDAHWIGVELPAALAHLVVSKGSVALSGVSLTVARLEAARLEVMIVPFTWRHTNLSSLRAGDLVNLECDMVGKYVARAVEGFKGRW
jgi:riboflavin synthase